MNEVVHPETADPNYQSLYKIGGAALWDIPLEIVGVWLGIFIARKAGGQQHVGN